MKKRKKKDQITLTLNWMTKLRESTKIIFVNNDMQKL